MLHLLKYFLIKILHDMVAICMYIYLHKNMNVHKYACTQMETHIICDLA